MSIYLIKSNIMQVCLKMPWSFAKKSQKCEICSWKKASSSGIVVTLDVGNLATEMVGFIGKNYEINVIWRKQLSSAGNTAAGIGGGGHIWAIIPSI